MMEQASVQDWDRDALLAQALRYRRLARQIIDDRACQAALDLAREYEAKAAAAAARTVKGNGWTQ
jgi:hypothetical protein